MQLKCLSIAVNGTPKNVIGLYPLVLVFHDHDNTRFHLNLSEQLRRYPNVHRHFPLPVPIVEPGEVVKRVFPIFLVLVLIFYNYLFHTVYIKSNPSWKRKNRGFFHHVDRQQLGYLADGSQD